ncbi:hypothetical protein FSW04_20145 [Baekduia soli]|uniref:P27 family phage terminase small subunit n=1 Tax=Baekduia soli TaxID=496014 RepID=A0A5B8U932_9ACTN|nr:hypothetical protein [Baekduia soli]QEC49659.1 hypothetical protein FSW04_20145 [Baekduia soli]
MGATPTFERPPAGLDAHWLGVWRTALKALKAAGTWDQALYPLLVEYLRALQAADAARTKGHTTAWDRAARRAMALASQLGLTPAGQRRGDRRPATRRPAAPVAIDPIDELAAARATRAHTPGTADALPASWTRPRDDA